MKKIKLLGAALAAVVMSLFASCDLEVKDKLPLPKSGVFYEWTVTNADNPDTVSWFFYPHYGKWTVSVNGSDPFNMTSAEDWWKGENYSTLADHPVVLADGESAVISATCTEGTVCFAVIGKDTTASRDYASDSNMNGPWINPKGGNAIVATSKVVKELISKNDEEIEITITRDGSNFTCSMNNKN